MSPEAASCIYHPGVIAISVCSECAGKICRACEQIVANKPVCNQCVQRIRQKIANEQPITPPLAGYAGGQYAGAPIQNSAATHAILKGPAPKATSTGMLLGFVAAFVVATIGAILWAKIFLIANFMLSIGYIFIGMGAAIAINKVSKTYGIMNAVLADVAYILGMTIGHIVYVQDAVAAQGGRIGFGSEALTLAFQNMSPLHWVWVIVGVVYAFITANKPTT